MDELIELTEKLGIELVTIDVTKYVHKALMSVTDITPLENKQFSIECNGAIPFEIFGIWNAVGDALVSRIEFNIDLEYDNGVEKIKTKCVFDSDAVEKAINQIKK
jgi:hypothetical protein